MIITVIKVILANNDEKVWLYFYLSAPRAELELAQIYTGTFWDLIFDGKNSTPPPRLHYCRSSNGLFNVPHLLPRFISSRGSRLLVYD